MFARLNLIAGVLTVVMVLGLGLPAMADEAVDKAFEALKTYDWGNDRNLLGAIDDAVAASNGDAAAQKDLETRLAAVLGSDAKHAAKDYACRKLSLIASPASVPALAALLGHEKLSHMGRYALERMPAPEAIAAIRDAMPKVKGKLKVGMINSLGVRRDAASTGALAALLADSDAEVAAAAAAALGSIGSPEAAKALAKAPESLKTAVADACLACAEQLLADGKKMDAMMIYKALAKPDQPKHVRVAATRGLLAATSK